MREYYKKPEICRKEDKKGYSNFEDKFFEYSSLTVIFHSPFLFSSTSPFDFQIPIPVPVPISLSFSPSISDSPAPETGVMKFGKSLSNQIEETLPEWRDKFLSYKELKKRLKLVEPKGGDRPSKRPRIDAAGSSAEDGETDDSSSEEMNFIRLLEDELEKFNTFFVEKEEEYIIRLKVFLRLSSSLLLVVF